MFLHCRDFSMKVPPLKLGSGELTLPGVSEGALQQHSARTANGGEGRASSALVLSSAAPEAQRCDICTVHRRAHFKAKAVEERLHQA